jgi:hypothetical protein
MNMFQWIMLGAAAFLVAPMVFDKLKGFISIEIDDQDANPSVPTPPPVSPVPDHVDSCGGLVDVVECWEHLCNCCESQGMKDAARELKKVFPLFVIQEVENE